MFLHHDAKGNRAYLHLLTSTTSLFESLNIMWALSNYGSEDRWMSSLKIKGSCKIKI
ncbi:MAG: hypothetical protein ACLTMS_21470 [Bacteroides faecis]